MVQLRDEYIEANKLYKEDAQIRERIDRLVGQLLLRLNNSDSDVLTMMVNLADISLKKGEDK